MSARLSSATRHGYAFAVDGAKGSEFQAGLLGFHDDETTEGDELGPRAGFGLRREDEPVEPGAPPCERGRGAERGEEDGPPEGAQDGAGARREHVHDVRTPRVDLLEAGGDTPQPRVVWRAEERDSHGAVVSPR